jgi:hypothetical protein
MRTQPRVFRGALYPAGMVFRIPRHAGGTDSRKRLSKMMGRGLEGKTETWRGKTFSGCETKRQGVLHQPILQKECAYRGNEQTYLDSRNLGEGAHKKVPLSPAQTRPTSRDQGSWERLLCSRLLTRYHDTSLGYTDMG